jgi:hypothetical protein
MRDIRLLSAIMMGIYWMKHGGNKEKSRFSGRVSTSKHRKKCVGDAGHIRVFVPGIL